MLGELGNRIQHALRAFTPRDQKAVKTAADTFHPNPELDTAQVITELGVGEALVSVLDANGTPTQVERTLIGPPRGRVVGPLSDTERATLLADSSLAGRYDERMDGASAAHERLEARLAAQAQASHATNPREPDKTRPGEANRDPSQHPWERLILKKPSLEGAQAARPPAAARPSRDTGGGHKRQGVMETLLKSVMRALGSQLGRSLIRSLLRSFTRR